MPGSGAHMRAELCLCAVSCRALASLASPRLRASVPHAATDSRIKGADMAMAALRQASRCLAFRGSLAAARPMLLAQSRGITYKLFVGGWFFGLNCPFPPPSSQSLRARSSYFLTSRVLCSLSCILLVEGSTSVECLIRRQGMRA